MMATLAVFRRLRLRGAVSLVGSGSGGERSVSSFTLLLGSESCRRRLTRNGDGDSRLTNCKRITNSSGVNCGGSYQLLTAGFKSFPALYQATDAEQEALKGDKLLRVKLRSSRVDAVLKSGLSMSRSKVEKALYEDRIRVNGFRPKKKSQPIKEGDEIDVVRGYNKLNPDFLDVNRVEVEELGEAKEDEDSAGSDSDTEDESPTSKIPAVLRRSKMLTVKNYKHAWKGKAMDD